MSARNDHNVHALNASTGAKLWSYTTGGHCVFLARGGQWGGLYRLRGQQRLCAECLTGAKLWSYTTGSEVYSSPAVANGVVYVGSFDGNVYCAGRLDRR